MFIHVKAGEKTSIYQCQRAHFLPQSDEYRVFLEIEDRDGGITLDLIRSTSEVYFMNDNGRTIDSYQWAENDVVAIPVDSEKVKA